MNVFKRSDLAYAKTYPSLSEAALPRIVVRYNPYACLTCSGWGALYNRGSRPNPPPARKVIALPCVD